jgi:hypothetical protein
MSCVAISPQPLPGSYELPELWFCIVVRGQYFRIEVFAAYHICANQQLNMALVWSLDYSLSFFLRHISSALERDAIYSQIQMILSWMHIHMDDNIQGGLGVAQNITVGLRCRGLVPQRKSRLRSSFFLDCVFGYRSLSQYILFSLLNKCASF